MAGAASQLAVSDELDLGLTLPVSALMDELACPICFSLIKECMMSPCGHNFCRKCLLECLNVAKRCPVCSQDVDKSQCLDNKGHDRVVDIIRREREVAAQRHFEDMIDGGSGADGGAKATGGDGGATDAGSGDAPPAPKKKLSAIEEVFQAHLTRSLLSYEQYLDGVRTKFASSKAAAKAASDARVAALREEKPEDLDRRVAAEAARLEAVLSDLDTSLAASTDLLRASYQEYLQSAMPASPEFLPAAVALEVPSQGMVVPRHIVKPTDCAQDLVPIITAKFESVDNPLVNIPDEACRWVIRLPYHTKGGAGSNGSGSSSSSSSSSGKAEAPDSTAAAASDSSSSSAAGAAAAGSSDAETKPPSGVVVIDDVHRPLLQYGLVQGAAIVLEGPVRCKSDMPKQCFRQVFEAGKEQPIDYFSCRTCKKNWICRTCAEHCHADHRVVEYISQHSPSWACCYCIKTKKCKLARRGA